MASLAVYNPILARAAARATSFYLRNRGYLRAAKMAGSFAWKHRAAFKKMGSRRRFKRGRPGAMYKVSRKRARISGAPSSSPRTQAYYDQSGAPTALTSTTVILQRKFLWNTIIRLCKAPSATDNLGAAEANRIYLKGIKVYLNIDNLSNALNNRAVVHFAIVQEKSDGNTGLMNKNDFFTNPGGGEQGLDRTINFVDAGTAVVPDQRYNCNGINKQRWNVVTHKKFLLDAAGDNTSGKSFKRFERYYKFGKPMIFETASEQNVSRPLRALVWWERFNSDVDTLDNNIRFNLNTISYFRSKG